MEQARAQILPDRAAVGTCIRKGIPGNEMLSKADQGGYHLVVGATGSTHMKQHVLGRVSSKVAWNAACSVLLVEAAGSRL